MWGGGGGGGKSSHHTEDALFKQNGLCFTRGRDLNEKLKCLADFIFNLRFSSFFDVSFIVRGRIQTHKRFLINSVFLNLFKPFVCTDLVLEH